MPNLTPADVRNVAFSKPPIGRRGYDEEQVDAFLDQVERTLAAMGEEIEMLRAQLRGGPGSSSYGAANDPVLVELDQIKIRLARIETAVTRGPQSFPYG
jgi:DivIVA domain-containing protein